MPYITQSFSWHSLLSIVPVFNSAQEPPSWGAICSSLITALLGFLQILFSGTDSSPFELHPVITMASIVFLVEYYLAFGAKLMFPAYASQFESAMLVSGSFCVIALLSLLLLAIPWPSWFVLRIKLLVCGCIILMGCGCLLLLLKFRDTHGLPLRRRSPRIPQPLIPLFNVNPTATFTSFNVFEE